MPGASTGGSLTDEVLAVFSGAAVPSKPRTAVEVAAELDADLLETAAALVTLAERDELASRDLAGDGRVWWRPPPEQREAEQSFRRRQFDELARLNRVNTIVRRVVRAIVGAETREDLEREVCEVLADADLYRFAVSGEFSSSFDEFVSHAVAGGPADYFERVLESDDRPPVAESIGARASRTGEIQYVQRLEDADYELWREVARRTGVGSYAAVPLVHQGVVYGVLGVYAVEPEAFESGERSVLAELGEVVGYAIHSLERTDVREPAIELVFASADLAAPFLDVGATAAADGEDGAVPDGDTGGKGDDADRDATDETGEAGDADAIEIDVDSVVTLPDGSQLQYWDVTGLSATAAVEVIGASKTANDARLVSTVDGVHRVELHCPPESVFASIAPFDGRLASIVVSEGELRATMRFETEVDVDAVTRAVRDVYPSLELASRRRVLTETYLRRIVDEMLTERQATVLRVAHAGGYFRQPRASTGEELAAQLGITRQTFNYHLRRAEAAVFDALLDPDGQ